MSMGKQNIGPAGDSFESFLEEQGIRDEVYGAAVKRVLAWQFEEARKAANLGKVDLAHAMHTSRSQIDRVLDPENVAVSLDTLSRAAMALGKRLKIELIDPPA
jgi:antitoxin HicB